MVILWIVSDSVQGCSGFDVPNQVMGGNITPPHLASVDSHAHKVMESQNITQVIGSFG